MRRRRGGGTSYLLVGTDFQKGFQPRTDGAIITSRDMTAVYPS